MNLSSSGLLRALQEQRKNNQFCDVSIHIGNRIFYAHRCILAARSPVFAAMLQDHYRESKLGLIELKEIDAEVFSNILSFLYAQEIHLDSENVCTLLQFADMYQISVSWITV